MIREQDREPLRRLIGSAFAIERDYDQELKAIAHDESMTLHERSEKYLDFIIDHLEFIPDEEEK